MLSFSLRAFGNAADVARVTVRVLLHPTPKLQRLLWQRQPPLQAGARSPRSLNRGVCEGSSRLDIGQSPTVLEKAKLLTKSRFIIETAPTFGHST